MIDNLTNHQLKIRDALNIKVKQIKLTFSFSG